MGIFDWFRKKPKPAGADAEGEAIFREMMEMMKKGPPPPERPMVYLFEHAALRDAVFENHPGLIRDLEGSAAPVPFLLMWGYAEMQMVARGLKVPGKETEEEMAVNMKLMKEVSFQKHQYHGHSVYVI